MASFEEWVQAAFDHPPKEPEWYWDEGFDSFWDSLGLSDAVTVQYLTRLLLEPEHLKSYSLAQVAHGIWFLIGGASPSKVRDALVDPEVPVGKRVNCIQAMAEFFRNFVAPAAPGPADTESDNFHIACSMWWHILPISPTHWGSERIEPELHKMCLKVMTELLDLPSELCHLSALHGLNHWHELYAEEVEEIVDTFLSRGRDMTSRIREYATQARSGLCQ